MPKKSKFKYSLEGEPLYPHIKLTSERFPRLLATRIIANEDAEYFGAFLNRTNARMLIDFLNRTFKLRSCDIEIDGSFNYPCTMFYKKRCLAPCIADLIDEPSYGEMVGLVRLFLANERGLLSDLLNTRIRISSNDLDYEAAAKWRDILVAVEEYWEDTRHAVWLDGSSDTFYASETEHGLDIFIITQKGRRVLGERIFSFEGANETDFGAVVSDVIEQFYKFHAPKEIRLDRDFPQRSEVQTKLSSKFGRPVPIRILNEKNRKVSSELAINRSRAELDVKRSIISKPPKELMREFKNIFSLAKIPKRISAVDVSHISGTNQVAASVVWENGRTVSSGARYLLSESSSELETLGEFVGQMFKGDLRKGPELLLIDGGRSHLNVAVSKITDDNISIIAAVKPPGEHFEVSHFLTLNGRLEFDPGSDTHRLLQRLRDEAHDYVNAIHRETRDYAHFYEMVNILPSMTETERQQLLAHFGSSAAVVRLNAEEIARVVGAEKAKDAVTDIENYKSGNASRIHPLVVPVRFQDENGAADNLLPIASTQAQVKRRTRVATGPPSRK